MLSRLDRLGDCRSWSCCRPRTARRTRCRTGRSRRDAIDNRVRWDLDAQNSGALFDAALNIHRASIGPPPVDNVRDHVLGRATTRTRRSSRP
ncbi:hypothetical protein GCM10023176_33160 [Micromonospora coerulea]|uniref:Tn3 transposase DDE domain-containing protein n=1 Tax=Micromonospora coerulea TaxID=47856 RepID=A0ABP8SQE5_9ACTN